MLLTPGLLTSLVEEAPEVLSLPASVEVINPNEEQLVAVYVRTAAEAAAEVAHLVSTVTSVRHPPCVRYLHLPQQQEEYAAAVEQGLRVVPMKGLKLMTGTHAVDSSSSSFGCPSISVEELTWLSQEKEGCWGQEEPAADRYTLAGGGGGGGSL
jgi:hypothetical protein